MLKKILLLLLFCSLNAFSQNPKLSENTQVSIFTCGRGEELYSTFGHTALRIKDDENQLDVVFNYGAFDFRTENFYTKFVKGDLQYFMVVTSYEDFILEYQTDGREVIEQTLNLSAAKKQQLFESLSAVLYSPERYYTYKFIDRNCTTMVAEKISALIGQKELEKIDDKSISYREVLYPYFENYFWYKLGINIIFGAKTDAKAEKVFLPVELMHSLDKATIDDIPVVAEKKTIINSDEKEVKFEFFNSIYFIIIVLLMLILINKRVLFYGYLFFSGILGIFLCLVGLYSEHQEVLWNYNALLFNPLFMALPFVKKTFLNKICNLSIAIVFIYAIIMINKPHLLIMLPFMITAIYILLKISGKNPLGLLTSIK
ncbi:lipoprotein N-acyltransferase Lnb domain-containing protein [Flavobacterium sp. RSB2_4_14]|uniref:lipoprotein N-acyltransferase Lnb domain-containing protein n=1 Tax=Flavobacterium sp. RSB2_4_14 TaxID=3447665 RepID=UPI003F30AD21